jgi:hypothetical protein
MIPRSVVRKLFYKCDVLWNVDVMAVQCETITRATTPDKLELHRYTSYKQTDEQCVSSPLKLGMWIYPRRMQVHSQTCRISDKAEGGERDSAATRQRHARKSVCANTH